MKEIFSIWNRSLSGIELFKPVRGGYGERRSLRDLDEAPKGNYAMEDIECSLMCHLAEQHAND